MDDKSKLYQALSGLYAGLSAEVAKRKTVSGDLDTLEALVGTAAQTGTIYEQLTAISGALDSANTNAGTETSNREAADTAISGRLDGIDKAISGYAGEYAISSKFEDLDEEIQKLKDEGGDHALSSITVSGALAVTEYADHTQKVGLNIASGDKFLTQSDAGLSATIGFKKITDGLDSTIASKYYMTDKDGNQVGEAIEVYKDQFLKKAEFVNTTTGNDALKLTFNTLSGTEDVVEIPLSGLFDDYQAGSGIQRDGLQFKGVVDPASESGFFTVGENGFKVAGVQDAIDKAAKGVQDNLDTLSGNISGAFEADKVVIGTATGLSSTVYTIGDDALSGAAAGDATKLVTSKQVVDYVNEGLSDLDAKIATLLAEI